MCIWNEQKDSNLIGGSGSGKTNSLFILISHQPDIDTIYLYAKDSYESLIGLRNSVNSKKIPKNENPNKIIDIVEKTINFNKK